MAGMERVGRNFVEHIVKAPSQYDSTCRELAAELLNQVARVAALEAENAQLRQAIKELAMKWSDAAVFEFDEMSNTQSASTFDQCARELELLVVPPPPPGDQA